MTGPAGIILSRAPGQILAALVGSDGLEAFEIIVTLRARVGEAPARLRDIMLGRVSRVVRGAGGALIDLGPDGMGFLPLGQPVLARRPRGEGWHSVDQPEDGQAVLTQIARLGQASGETAKGPRLTGDVQIPGRACIYRLSAPAKERVRMSRQLGGDDAASLKDRVKGVLGDTDGFILRTAAAQADGAAVAAEAAVLRARGQEVLDQAIKADPPVRLWRDGPPLARLLREWVGPHGCRVVVDDPILAKDVESILDDAVWPPVEIVRLPHGQSALAEADIEDQIDRLTRRHVPLAGGGSIVIDGTEALTAIDVNGGGRRGLEVNLEAASAIARQIRLRDIGGLIVIDFIDLKEPRHRDRVLETLRQGLILDGAPVRFGVFSGFGTLELTRARSGAGASDAWMRPCPTCDGTGRVLSREAAGLALLRALPVISRESSVAVGAELAGWIEGQGEGLKAAFEAVGRMPPVFRRAQDLPPLGWRVDGTI